MFANCRLPTLDTEIWVDEISHSFYEKPTCPNRVVQSDTALAQQSIHATLTQETVRRLKYCSDDVSLEEKQDILSTFAQKMCNSGHSIGSIQYILVHGVTKYMEMERLSKLPETDELYTPLHSSKYYNMYKRKLHKMMQKSGWFSESEVVKKTEWRSLIPRGWSGCKPAQFSVKGMKYSSVMQVPSSRNGRLLKMLARAEPRLAKVTGYQVKYVEKSGKKLTKYFKKEKSINRCHRDDCDVCCNSDLDHPSMCQVKGVVYSGICLMCEEEFKGGKSLKHNGGPRPHLPL